MSVVSEAAGDLAKSAAIVRQAFDTDALGIPFYRVKDLDRARLAGELPSIAALRPVIIDAKLPAHDVSMGAWLMERGFRKVCTQVELLWSSERFVTLRGGEATLAGALALSDEEVLAHARNFTQDRFSQDFRLPRAGVERLYARWIRNVTGGREHVMHIGTDFCTFTLREKLLKMNLMSVLEKRRGVGGRIVAAILAHARELGCEGVTLVTECENAAAWRLYLRVGFEVVTFYSVFHFAAKRDNP